MFRKSKSYENMKKESNNKGTIRPVVSNNDVDSLSEEKNSFLHEGSYGEFVKEPCYKDRPLRQYIMKRVYKKIAPL